MSARPYSRAFSKALSPGPPYSATIQPTGVLQLSEPINAGDAKISGFELNGQTFLDFVPSPWNGFGVSANLTYLNGYNPNTGQFEGPS